MTINIRGKTAHSPLAILIAVILLAASGIFAFWMYTHASRAQQTAEGSARIVKLKTVGSALETFRVAHTRYPEALGALLEENGEQTILSRTYLNEPGYSYEYKPSPDNFALHLKPDGGQGAHYLTDNSGNVRVSLNSPATASSPLWAE